MGTSLVHYYTENPSRTEVRTVPCPACGAAPGTKCMGSRKLREANHLERVKVYAQESR